MNNLEKLLAKCELVILHAEPYTGCLEQAALELEEVMEVVRAEMKNEYLRVSKSAY